MKKGIVFILAAVFCSISYGQSKKDLIKEIARLKTITVAQEEQLQKFQNAKNVDLQDSIQNFSYAFGVSIGNNLKTIGFDSIAYDTFAIAIENAINGEEKMNVKDAQRIVQSTVLKLQEKEAKIKSEKGRNFLEENGKRPEVITTTTGLQYEIIVQGSGAIPKASDRIKIHYTGRFIDGKVFDSSIEKGIPAVFLVKEVVKGWQEALQLMPVGSKWKVYIPQDLAYGPNGRAPLIPPYSALTFEMELLGIE